MSDKKNTGIQRWSETCDASADGDGEEAFSSSFSPSFASLYQQHLGKGKDDDDDNTGRQVVSATENREHQKHSRSPTD
eukprot:CAMPEP_0204629364 /NCGR_PEP_ID=MMETSP0717-20131115/18069_1 /ASSEMBLY_ACC=CAM_ASM_000666 /TAXON_ID=230516 /ORGANISM="Chaetoceros curvisetus" /LENGTH=77 /DNA_ID=CAMNT_0051646287 /DNA_START=102 /DNA_END=332 /DNA_ORIENTATION=+